ncbi:PorT family protein [Pontibacter burrus]|uniref:PorT family protein n=1 Tax=Pontibacter burrus TaxID=2704466 RepID=A0A6B3LKV2_9BACT|nr:PorT family protein [Pontibacter burrus]NEM97562.1 PorT family protein [Pontibacter burrus]
MKTIFTTLFCLLAVSSYAQKNFVKGYYITTAGDTVQSYIDDKNWVKAPDRIRVASSPESNTVTTFSAADIKGFGLANGDRFVSEIVQIDKSPVDVNQMIVGAAPIIVTDTVFLRVLVNGKLNLLYMEDESAKQHFYIQQQNTAPEELRLIKKLINANATQYVSNIEEYKETLARHLHDCPDVAEGAYTAELKATNLTKLITKYNACFPEEGPMQYVAKTDKVKLKLSVGAGLMPTTLNITKSDFNYNLKPGSLASNYTAGIGFGIVLPRAKGRWEIYNEAAFKTYQVEGAYEVINQPNEYRHEEIKFEMRYIGLNTMIRYNFPFKTILPFVNVGIANNYMLGSSNEVKLHTRRFSIEEHTTVPMLESVRKYEQAFLVGVGVNVKGFVGEVRYENGTGMSPYKTTGTSRKTINLLLGYSFNQAHK